MTPPGKVDYKRIKHEFGDTRYRRILYRLEATSRFREFMPAVIREPLVPGETNPQIKVISEEVNRLGPQQRPAARTRDSLCHTNVRVDPQKDRRQASELARWRWPSCLPEPPVVRERP